MIEAYGLSDPGCVRTNNEDFFLLAPELGLYVVADGMGGAKAGEDASKLAAETVADVVWQAGRRDADVLFSAFQEANRRVIEAANNDETLEGMGTTLVAALECNAELLFASVGDSRAYMFADDRLQAITEDQTWVEEVGRRLGIDEQSLRTHPMRHVLTMAIGAGSPLRIHQYSIVPRPGSQFLMCSDGLHGVLGPDAIAEALRCQDSLEAKCGTLIQGARAAGGPDNITAVLLRAVDGA
jgi:serine/threonine protein phosphatase PrpC